MTRQFAPDRLDVIGFADAAAVLSGCDPVSGYPRLAAELVDPAAQAVVRWNATGENRAGSAGAAVAWLQLSAQTCVPLVCQRCLAPVDVDLHVDRAFRFVADEATAAAEDEASEEDVLAAGREFDLHALIEDELLMEIPAAPRHGVCPEPVRLSVEDADFELAEAARPHPFAALGALRRGGSDPS